MNERIDWVKTECNEIERKQPVMIMNEESEMSATNVNGTKWNMSEIEVMKLMNVFNELTEMNQWGRQRAGAPRGEARRRLIRAINFSSTPTHFTKRSEMKREGTKVDAIEAVGAG